MENQTQQFNRQSILLAENIDETAKFKDAENLLENFGEELSRRLNSSLHVLYVQGFPKTFLRKQPRSSLGPLAKSSFESLYHSLREGDSRVHFSIEEGETAQKVNEWARNHEGARLIMVGVPPSSGVKKNILNRVQNILVENPKVPLLVFGPEAFKNSFRLAEEERFRILLVTDLSRHSRMAEVYAHYLAKKTSGHIVVLHSGTERVRDFKKSFKALELNEQSLDLIGKNMQVESKNLHERRVDYLKSRGISAEGLFFRDEKSFEKEILREIEEGYDLVIMGTNSHSPSILGSTARKILQKSKSPVMLCHSPHRRKQSEA